MANTFTKLFESILESTVWQESLPVKVMWITMMAMADREGKVWASVPGLARRAGVGLDDAEAALEKFLGPDPYSRTTENEGRRIEVIDGGWRLLNHGKYRAMMGVEERREYQRIKQAEYRAKKKGGTAVERVADRFEEEGKPEEAERTLEIEAQRVANLGTEPTPPSTPRGTIPRVPNNPPRAPSPPPTVPVEKTAEHVSAPVQKVMSAIQQPKPGQARFQKPQGKPGLPPPTDGLHEPFVW